LTLNFDNFLKTEHWPYLLNGKWYGFHISYACSLWQDFFFGTLNFDILTLILSFNDDRHLWNLPHKVAFVFHNISCLECYYCNGTSDLMLWP
jgi:hypothetical protein